MSDVTENDASGLVLSSGSPMPTCRATFACVGVLPSVGHRHDVLDQLPLLILGGTGELVLLTFVVKRISLPHVQEDLDGVG
jgi:hypothetical protein